MGAAESLPSRTSSIAAPPAERRPNPNCDEVERADQSIELEHLASGLGVKPNAGPDDAAQAVPFGRHDELEPFQFIRSARARRYLAG